MAETVVAATPPAPAEAPPVEKSTGDRPAWLPEKFKSPEDMAKAYSELEKKQGGAKPEAEAAPVEDGGQTAEAPSEGGEPAPAEEAPAPVSFEVPGVAKEDLQSMSAEFQKDGKLSDVSYTMLEMAGYPKAMVDQYIAGASAQKVVEQHQTQIAQADVAEVKAEVGGEENFAKLVNWAKTGLSQAEKDAYHKMIGGSNKEQAKAAVNWLNSKMEASEGREPSNPLGGGPAGTTGARGFRSMDEMRAAQRDERYKRGDPAYHADFIKRLEASTF